jgi:hypothetical protein
MSKGVKYCGICGGWTYLINKRGTNNLNLCRDCWNDIHTNWLGGGVFETHETYKKLWDVGIEKYINHIRQKKLELL